MTTDDAEVLSPCKVNFASHLDNARDSHAIILLRLVEIMYWMPHDT